MHHHTAAAPELNEATYQHSPQDAHALFVVGWRRVPRPIATRSRLRRSRRSCIAWNWH